MPRLYPPGAGATTSSAARAARRSSPDPARAVATAALVPASSGKSARWSWARSAAPFEGALGQQGGQLGPLAVAAAGVGHGGQVDGRR
ncbi:MAG TPA: hypothetical protein VGB14_11435 [Acidimicrobiales bacterium]